jgi:hypothetical protein
VIFVGKGSGSKKTCCALGDQDAILGHAASRGDRYPRVANKLLALYAVNDACEQHRHEKFSLRGGTSGKDVRRRWRP